MPTQACLHVSSFKCGSPDSRLSRSKRRHKCKSMPRVGRTEALVKVVIHAGIGPGVHYHILRMDCVYISQDRPCLTQVHTHGFTRKAFARNNLIVLSTPCL